MYHARASGRGVQVSRNGNSRTLTIPADVAEREQIDVGEIFYVEVVPGGILYRRAKELLPGRRFVGEGQDRYLALPEGAAVPAGEDPAPVAAIDWDY